MGVALVEIGLGQGLSTGVTHALCLEPIGQIVGDVGWTVIGRAGVAAGQDWCLLALTPARPARARR
jgi:hypothetical protein